MLVHINYQRFRPTQEGFISFTSPTFLPNAVKALSNATVGGYPIAVHPSKPPSEHQRRTRGFRGRAQAAERGAFSGDGPGASIPKSGQNVVVSGLPTWCTIEDMQRIAQVEDSNREIFIKSIDLFLNFKLVNQALLSCVENTTKKWSFKESDIYQTLFNYYLPLVGNDLDEMLAKFKVDALLNTLSTQNYEFQLDSRGLTNKQIRDQIVATFYDHN